MAKSLLLVVVVAAAISAASSAFAPVQVDFTAEGAQLSFPQSPRQSALHEAIASEDVETMLSLLQEHATKVNVDNVEKAADADYAQGKAAQNALRGSLGNTMKNKDGSSKADAYAKANMVVGLLDSLDRQVLEEQKALRDQNPDHVNKLATLEHEFETKKSAWEMAHGKLIAAQDLYAEAAGLKREWDPILDKQYQTIKAEYDSLGEFLEILDKMIQKRLDANKFIDEKNAELDNANAHIQAQVDDTNQYGNNVKGANSDLSTGNAIQLIEKAVSVESTEETEGVPSPAMMEHHHRRMESSAADNGKQGEIDAAKAKHAEASKKMKALDGVGEIKSLVNDLRSEMMAQMKSIQSQKKRINDHFIDTATKLASAEKAELIAQQEYEITRYEYYAQQLINHKLEVFEDELAQLERLRGIIYAILKIHDPKKCSNSDSLYDLGIAKRISSDDGEDDENKPCFGMITVEDSLKLLLKSRVHKIEGESDADFDVRAKGQRDVIETEYAQVSDWVWGRVVCRHWGGELASIHNADENKHVLGIMEELAAKPHPNVAGYQKWGYFQALFGAFDVNGPNKWEFSDHTQFDYDINPEFPGAPTNIKRFGNWASLDTVTVGGGDPAARAKFKKFGRMRADWSINKPLTDEHHDAFEYWTMSPQVPGTCPVSQDAGHRGSGSAMMYITTEGQNDSKSKKQWENLKARYNGKWFGHCLDAPVSFMERRVFITCRKGAKPSDDDNNGGSSGADSGAASASAGL